MVSKTTGILQDWVTTLPVSQRDVLLDGLHGVSSVADFKASRTIKLKLSRVLLSHQQSPGFKTISIEDVDQLLAKSDQYPLSLVIGLMEAIEVVGYKHPSDTIRQCWRAAYCHLVGCLHLNPETEQQLALRSK